MTALAGILGNNGDCGLGSVEGRRRNAYLEFLVGFGYSMSVVLTGEVISEHVK